MSPRIEVRGLRVVAVHGLLEEERRRAQPFEIDIDVELAASTALASDDLADTVDYGGLIRLATEVVTGAPHLLLESLAGAVADSLVAVAGVAEATVTVRKLRPPVPADVASVGVRVTRGVVSPALLQNST